MGLEEKIKILSGSIGIHVGSFLDYISMRGFSNCYKIDDYALIYTIPLSLIGLTGALLIYSSLYIIANPRKSNFNNNPNKILGE